MQLEQYVLYDKWTDEHWLAPPDADMDSWVYAPDGPSSCNQMFTFWLGRDSDVDYDTEMDLV